MTKAFSNAPLWPYIGVIACLLVLTMLAPRTWKTPSQQATSFGDSQDLTAPPPSIEVATVSTPRTLDSAIADSTDSLRQAVGTLSLSQFEAPRQIANVAPPVTERVEFDPSVGDLPSLPTPDAVAVPPRIEIAPRLSPPPTPVGTVAVPVEKKAAEASPLVSTYWAMPKNLLTRLEKLTQVDECRSWAERVVFTLERLHESDSITGGDVVEYLNNLDASVTAAQALAESASTDALRSTVLRTRYALERRVEIWRRVRDIVDGRTTRVSVHIQDDAHLTSQIQDVLDYISKSEHGAAWKDYLLLDEISALIESGTSTQRREIARRVLERTESPRLKDNQIAVLAKAPFSNLAVELRRWATEPVDYLALLDDMEAYEESRLTGAAHALAKHCQNARWSSNAAIEDLSETLNVHYRNANVRVAASSELINRLLPPVAPSDDDIDEVIFGARVYGHSRTHTQLEAKLVPDRARWRIGLEARGEVESETAASSGPATFYNAALSQYLARKLILANRNGVVVWGAEAEADSETGLRGMTTDFDGIPILNWLVRSIALDEHDKQFRGARRAAEERLAERASERLDDEVHKRLIEGERGFKEKLLDPMRALNLKPVALDMHTTSQRLIGRYRFASDDQLGANTPRPRAPGDSLLSVQVHESALNNVLEQLGLEGKETDLRELYTELAGKFAKPDLQVPEDIPEGVTIRFAKDEAVRIRCEQGRVIVTLRIAELKQGRRQRWRNFSVRAYYVPDPTQLQANLVREGSIELTGRRITSFNRIALSGIFSKALSRTRPFNMMNRRIATSDALQDLQVTQFVVTHGWIGVALGPRYGADVEHLAEEPESSVLRR